MTIVEEELLAEPKIGTRVQVLSANGKQDLGFGTYMGRVLISEVPDDSSPSAELVVDEPVEVTDEEKAEVAAMVERLTVDGATTPKITLESGDVIYGFQCWWREAEEQQVSH